MEVHKRWDPLYTDARDRIRDLGDFSFFQSYMSQPKSQLHTFRAWAGKSSDISYYLNAHHIDFNVWAVGHRARPTIVRASAATGVAHAMGIPTEDTITLTVDWQNIESGNKATAIYTSSWIAPKADVHSQQRFFYMAHGGEISIDQAHRGYSLALDEAGFSSPNPLFMKFTPDADGYFSGQNGYGYRSIEVFLRAARKFAKAAQDPMTSTANLPLRATHCFAPPSWKPAAAVSMPAAKRSASTTTQTALSPGSANDNDAARMSPTLGWRRQDRRCAWQRLPGRIDSSRPLAPPACQRVRRDSERFAGSLIPINPNADGPDLRSTPSA